MLHGLFGSVVCCHLRGEGGAFPGTLEPLCAGARPGNHISLGIGNGNDGIIERCLDVSDPNLDILLDLLFLYRLPFGHISSFTPLEINLVPFSG
jgi:hypothetical protein